METLSYCDFKRYYDSKEVERVIYDSDNDQYIHDASSTSGLEPWYISLSFDRLVFYDPIPSSPDLRLVCNSGTMTLRNVERIAIKSYGTWDAVKVYCKGAAYMLLLDYMTTD